MEKHVIPYKHIRTVRTYLRGLKSKKELPAALIFFSRGFPAEKYVDTGNLDQIRAFLGKFKQEEGETFYILIKPHLKFAFKCRELSCA